MASNGTLGALGESVACEYLEKNGYRIICRNKRYGHFETDIICENDGFLAFVEVKTRTKCRYGRPASSVDNRKKQNLISCAESYIAEYGTNGKAVRLDVIEVYMTKNGIRTEHLTGAITK